MMVQSLALPITREMCVNASAFEVNVLPEVCNDQSLNNEQQRNIIDAIPML